MQLAFITISGDEPIKDPVRQQQARTQAIKHSLQKKRRQLRLQSQNFVGETPNSFIKGRRQRQSDKNTGEPALSRRSASFKIGEIDPFSTLVIDATRLNTLLRHQSARQAGEPIFSVNTATEYQGLRSVFNAGLDDPALASALCLTLAFAANGGIMDAECACYRLQAIQHINAKLPNPDVAASTTTMGSVLLLIGVESRLGEREAAQVHLNGIRQLLQLCEQRRACLTHAIKRAIFWQDLFSSVMTGTSRIVDHNVFPELHWHRDPFHESIYFAPEGFACRSDDLGHEFLSIITDICALQHMREGDIAYPNNSLEVERVDNQQAWIESRLLTLQSETSETLLLCCIPAAFLCAYSIFAEVWSASLIPSRLSARLLQCLQDHETWDEWDDHADLLLWLLNTGAAFACDAPVRLGFLELWQGSHRSRLRPLSVSWSEIERHMKKFIFSDNIHGRRCKAFWERQAV